jgi:hypothetical protein
MQKLIRSFKIILPALILLQTSLFAQNDNDNDNKNDHKKKYEFVKTKSVNKSYNVSASDKLTINNQFGKVEVHTWAKNEIKVDVNVEVSANTNEHAQKILDRISVADSKSGGNISFKTKIDNVNNSKGEKSSMEINYSIYMPATNPLELSNQFGPTIIPDHRGEVDISSKFGSLTAGNLSNVKELNVEFGKATIGSINNGKVVIKYSNSTLGKLSGNIKMNIEFSTGIRMNLDNSLTGLDLNASYSTVNLKPDAGLNASYNISSSYGKLKNNTSIKFDTDDDSDNDGPRFDHQYSGRSGSGTVPVKVKTSFGNVILGEPGPDDMKKNKSKSKTRTS